MNIPATQIRNGMIVIYNGELHRVHEASTGLPEISEPSCRSGCAIFATGR